MKPRERIPAALRHEEPDRVPRFEIWIDGLLEELEQADVPSPHASLGQDCVLMPTVNPPQSNAWRSGVDEWGRVWEDGTFVDGVVTSQADLESYSPPLSYVNQLFDADQIRAVQRSYPGHCLIFGSHIGPFTAAFMAMGMKRFFLSLIGDMEFARQVLEKRTEWCIATYQRAVEMGAEVLVLGDDAGATSGPMISPTMWRQHILPYHRQITEALEAPVIWHSDGNVESLLPMAVDAGFIGVHGLDPSASMDLSRIKRVFGGDLVLVGNVDVRVLCDSNLGAVRQEVDRSIEQGAAQGGYMISSCNSIFDGMAPRAVAEMFRYEGEVGFY